MIKKNFLKKNYPRSFKYLGECKNFIFAVIFVFFLSSIFSFFIPPPDSVLKEILNVIQKLLEETKDMNQSELIRFIFLNNLQSSFFGMMLGIFLGIFPLISAIFNGYLLGFVASLSVEANGIFVLWKLLPHGIFELPAIFISLGMGLKIGTFIFQKNKMDSLKENLSGSLRVFLLIVIPLLAIASIIEGSLIFLFG